MQQTKINALIIASIVLLFFALTPNLAKPTSAISPSNSSKSDTSLLTQLLDNKYIGTLGLKSEITNVKSSISIQNDSVVGYKYTGSFSTTSKNYSVQTTEFRVTYGNQAITTLKEKIEGTTNSSTFAITNETTLADKVIRNTNLSILKSNSSGSYHFNLQSEVTLSANKSEILTGSARINQDIFGSVAQYSATFEPKKSNGNATIVLTYANEVQGNPTDNESELGALDDIEFPIYWAPMDPATCGVIFSAGIYIYWAQGLEVVAGPILSIIAEALVAACLLGVGLDIVGAVLAESAFFPATMTGNLGEYDETIMFMQVMFFKVSGILPAGFYWDAGFLSNYYYEPPLNNWQKIACPWTYFTCASTIGEFMIESIILGGRTDPWPNYSLIDPPVTFVAYDESNSNTINGVPVYADGTYIGLSGDTIYFPDGNYSIEMPSSNFHYFDIYSNPVYDNPTTVNLSGEDPVTITAYYYSVPTCTLTVNAYDAYLGEYYPYEVNVYIDNNWVGTTPLEIQVPMGDHSFTVDATVAYSPYWPAWDVPFYDFTGDFNGYNPAGNTVMISMYADSTINARYTQWQ